MLKDAIETAKRGPAASMIEVAIALLSIEDDDLSYIELDASDLNKVGSKVYDRVGGEPIVITEEMCRLNKWLSVHLLKAQRKSAKILFLIRSFNLWAATHDSFKDYVEEQLRISDQTAKIYARIGETMFLRLNKAKDEGQDVTQVRKELERVPMGRWQMVFGMGPEKTTQFAMDGVVVLQDGSLLDVRELTDAKTKDLRERLKEVKRLREENDDLVAKLQTHVAEIDDLKRLGADNKIVLDLKRDNEELTSKVEQLAGRRLKGEQAEQQIQAAKEEMFKQLATLRIYTPETQKDIEGEKAGMNLAIGVIAELHLALRALAEHNQRMLAAAEGI